MFTLRIIYLEYIYPSQKCRYSFYASTTEQIYIYIFLRDSPKIIFSVEILQG